MNRKWSLSLQAGVLVILVAFTLSLHYMVLPFPHWVHLVHRRLCYVPIILAALWFGTRGGLIVGSAISAATLPLALRFEGPLLDNQDFMEILFYLGLGLLTGLLVDRREADRARAMELGRRLEAAERFAAAGRVASGVAHEIRTPLGSIQGAAEILAEDYPPDHVRRPFFEILLQEIDRLRRVVDEFLDLGRSIPLNPGTVRAEDAVQDVIRALNPAAGLAGVVLEADVPRGCLVEADPHRLHQALANLVLNAIQVSPPSSRVKVAASERPEGCAFAVEDEGPGLPGGSEAKLFEPFFTRRKDGTGLGLALVKQIADAHGGKVWGETRSAGGARFTLLLPRKAAAGPGGDGA
ncbi:MAG: sensor histidine kinase [Acidobacteriota bacterium]